MIVFGSLQLSAVNDGGGFLSDCVSCWEVYLPSEQHSCWDGSRYAYAEYDSAREFYEAYGYTCVADFCARMGYSSSGPLADVHKDVCGVVGKSGVLDTSTATCVSDGAFGALEINVTAPGELPADALTLAECEVDGFQWVDHDSYSCHDRTYGMFAAWLFTILYGVLAGLKWCLDPEGDRYCKEPAGNP